MGHKTPIRKRRPGILQVINKVQVLLVAVFILQFRTGKGRHLHGAIEFVDGVGGLPAKQLGRVIQSAGLE